MKYLNKLLMKILMNLFRKSNRLMIILFVLFFYKDISFAQNATVQPLSLTPTEFCVAEGTLAPNADSPWPAQALLRQYYPSPSASRQIKVTIWIIRSSDGTSQPGIITSAQATEIVQQVNLQYTGTGVSFTINATNYIDNNLYSYSPNGSIDPNDPNNNGLTVSERDQLFQTYADTNTIDIYFMPVFWSNSSGGSFPQAIVPGLPYPTRKTILVAKYGTTIDAGFNSAYNAVKSGKVVAHELGHVFGLQHTHGFPGQAQELPDGSNYQNAGDWLLDTPAEDYNNNNGLSVNESGCTYVGSPTYSPGVVNGKYNHLSYATRNTRNCVGYFSYDQISEIHWALENDAFGIGLRGLLYSKLIGFSFHIQKKYNFAV